MNSLLAGRNTLITGGTRGIGREIALVFARAGAGVVTCSRNGSEDASRLAREFKDTGGDHRVLTADVSVADDVDRLVGECRATFGSLDVIVHNAGVISHVPFEELPLAEWRRVVDINLGGAYLVTQKALGLLSPGASVIFVGSRVATVGVPLRAHYTAAKAGLVGLARSLAKELGPLGVRVNVLAPGPVETDQPVPPEVRQRYAQMIALGRLGRPDDVAKVALFLASDLSGFISGETINVDGGI
jgi:3-oxoacyl-[acyl-carrier protein] reductase